MSVHEFTSLGEFAEHLGATILAMAAAENRALRDATKHLQTEVRKKLGTYQAAAGPFLAWAPLTPATQQQRSQQGYTPNDPLLRSGKLWHSIGERAGEGVGHVGSDLDEAVWMELGTRKVPPRSFLGSTAVEQEHKVVDLVGRDLFLALSGAKQGPLMVVHTP